MKTPVVFVRLKGDGRLFSVVPFEPIGEEGQDPKAWANAEQWARRYNQLAAERGVEVLARVERRPAETDQKRIQLIQQLRGGDPFEVVPPERHLASFLKMLYLEGCI